MLLASERDAMPQRLKIGGDVQSWWKDDAGVRVSAGSHQSIQGVNDHSLHCCMKLLHRTGRWASVSSNVLPNCRAKHAQFQL